MAQHKGATASTHTAEPASIPDLEDRLAVLGLSLTRSAELSGLARRTVERIMTPQVRALTLHKYITGIRRHGYDIDPEGKIVPHGLEAAAKTASIVQIPGTEKLSDTILGTCDGIRQCEDQVRGLKDLSFSLVKDFVAEDTTQLEDRLSDLEHACASFRARLESLK